MNLKQIAFVLVLLLLAAIILPNLRSLYEGIFFYLRDSITYLSDPPRPLQRDGRYASVYALAPLRNAERRAFILKRLESLKVPRGYDVISTEGMTVLPGLACSMMGSPVPLH